MSKICKKHGLSRTRAYQKYHSIKKRCYNKKASDYYKYGGKGIKMCNEWLNDFLAFNNWMIENGWNENSKLTIDRINPQKDYSPNNCRLVNLSVQSRNRLKTINNKSSKYLGVSYWKKSKKYVAQIMYNGKRLFLGSFENELDAVKSRDNWIVENNLETEYQLNSIYGKKM